MNPPGGRSPPPPLSQLWRLSIAQANPTFGHPDLGKDPSRGALYTQSPIPEQEAGPTTPSQNA